AALETRVEEALTAAGMAEHAGRPPHHLSFGQRRRAAVATVLAMRPEVLVLDEPTSHLDPAAKRELAEILKSLDLTMIVVTHDLPYALELCERAVVMNEGIITGDGPMSEILANEQLMRANRLELPYGFDPSFGRRPRHSSHRPQTA
ncbi:MAG: energy-coupling factor ABC transporter ATP-binding protein, partial [Actinomycetota bacterium]